jgi:ADP-heptose:LPS heptosyltransferase
MKTHSKIYIDRLIGLPLAWLLNGAARILGKVLRRDHAITVENVRTIVICKYLGMGSILQATPLVRSIRARFPEARLIFVTGHSCRRMIERLEHVDDILTVDDRSVFRIVRTSVRVIAILIWARVDLYFDLEIYSAYSSLVALLSLARNRIGFYRESAQHKRGNYTHLMYFNTRRPIRYTYLQLGRLAGCIPVEPNRLGRIRVDSSDRDEAARELAAVKAEAHGYFVVNPNASDLLVERRWPPERFAELIERLLEQHDRPIVLIGTPAERLYVSDVLARVREGNGHVLNLAGRLSLGGLFAVLEGAGCVITNDTGPMHMAWALGAPTTCLFGPVDPDQYAWHGAGVEVLYKQLYCSPCVHEVDEPPCRGDNVCMKRIAVDEVADAVKRLMTGVSVRPEGRFDPEFFSDQEARPLGRVVRGSI